MLFRLKGGDAMGIKNFLIEGVSGTGKTSVCNELQRRGYHSIHGDRELAYQGDPETGKRTDTASHDNHIWDVEKVKSLVANQAHRVTFFCGGSRNYSRFIHLFDEVFVLEIDAATLKRRLDKRPEDEFGGKKEERELVLRLHQTKEDIPKNGIIIDAAAPIEQVVNAIIRQIE
jgi:dephospho-CoA kinase